MNCEQIREHLEAYVLGALDDETRAAVEQHLAECADCRRLADEHTEMLARLPKAVAAASSKHPPAAIKARLLQTIAAETSRQPAALDTKSPTRLWQNLSNRTSRLRFQYMASIAVLVLLIFSFAWIARLTTALAYEQGLRENLSHQTELIFEIVDSDQTARHFLRATENAPAIANAAPPYGKVFTRADMPYVVAMTGRMPPPPSEQVYNLWLFRDGRAELAGALTIDDAGFGSLVYMADENGPVYQSAQLILQNINSDTPSGTVVLLWQMNGEN